MEAMVEKARQWLTILPAWIPIAGSILFAALWVGQHYQSINDRLNTLEKQMEAVQDYMKHEHKKTTAADSDPRYNKSDSDPDRAY